MKTWWLGEYGDIAIYVRPEPANLNHKFIRINEAFFDDKEIPSFSILSQELSSQITKNLSKASFYGKEGKALCPNCLSLHTLFIWIRITETVISEMWCSFCLEYEFNQAMIQYSLYVTRLSKKKIKQLSEKYVPPENVLPDPTDLF